MNDRQAKIQEDTHFRIMRILQETPDLTQRELVTSKAHSQDVKHIVNQLTAQKR